MKTTSKLKQVDWQAILNENLDRLLRGQVTRKDLFAMYALAGILANPGNLGIQFKDDMARVAWEIARMMEAEREGH